MASDRYDLVVIGGGTAGLIAAELSAGIGGRTALVEAERLGGDCLWTGCVPSKTLLAAVGVAHALRTADRHGLDPVSPKVDLARVMATVRRAQSELAPQDSPGRLRAQGVDVVQGRARFIAPGRIEVGERTLAYRAALVATGSRPVLPPIDGLQAVAPLTSDTIWDLGDLPPRLLVLGGGPVGCELGQAFARLGSHVTVVEVMASLLPTEARQVGEHLAQRLRAEGMVVRTGSSAVAVTGGPTGGAVHLGDGTTAEFDRVLVATGRRPDTTELGLERVGVDVDGDGHVVVDDMMRTTGDRVFAAGDVTGVMPFTHVAAHQARLVVGNALFRRRRRAAYERIPSVTFTDPEIARVGPDAAEARARWGTAAVVARFDYAGLDRAVTDGRTSGWAELVADPRRRLVGATVVGESAGETIAELVAWISTRRRVDDLSTAVHAYPTFTEGPSRAADGVLRARYFSPRVRRITRPLLAVLRRLDAPAGSAGS